MNIGDRQTDGQTNKETYDQMDNTNAQQSMSRTANLALCYIRALLLGEFSDMTREPLDVYVESFVTTNSSNSFPVIILSYKKLTIIDRQLYKGN